MRSTSLASLADSTRTRGDPPLPLSSFQTSVHAIVPRGRQHDQAAWGLAQARQARVRLLPCVHEVAVAMQLP